MTDTTTPKTDEAQDPALVAQESEAKSTTIPKERLDQEIAKRKAEADARKAAEEALSKMSKEIEELKKQAAPKNSDAGKTDYEALASQVAEIRERDLRRELQKSLSLQDEKQAESVHLILKASPDLKPSEALVIARTRQPDLFGSEDQRAFNPGQHGSLRPSGAGAPKAVTLKQRVEKLKQIQNPIERDREERRIHGQLLAKQLGWQRND